MGYRQGQAWNRNIGSITGENVKCTTKNWHNYGHITIWIYSMSGGLGTQGRGGGARRAAALAGGCVADAVTLLTQGQGHVNA